MSGKRKPYHSGEHHARARQLNATAKANPNTVCATCGYTIDVCWRFHPGRNRKPCTWDAGHRKRGDSRFGYKHQCSYCNRSEGAIEGNLDRAAEPREPWP